MNNPPAFPDGLGTKGMTLRDYFAAQIISGVVANQHHHHVELGDMRAYSNLAYFFADSMLKVREK